MSQKRLSWYQGFDCGLINHLKLNMNITLGLYIFIHTRLLTSLWATKNLIWVMVTLFNVISCNEELHSHYQYLWAGVRLFHLGLCRGWPLAHLDEFLPSWYPRLHRSQVAPCHPHLMVQPPDAETEREQLLVFIFICAGVFIICYITHTHRPFS